MCGDIAKSYEYDDYGVTSRTGEVTVNVLTYTGGVYDEETGQYYLNARYYDPEQGVFLTQDTYRGEQNQPATWNLYGYCGGNPVNYVDPSGHDAIWLQQTNGAMNLGHTAVAIQLKNAEWCYFSLSSANSKKFIKNICGNVGVMTVQKYKANYNLKWKNWPAQGRNAKEKTEFRQGLCTIDTTLKVARKKGISYDKGIYIKGDFLKSYTYLCEMNKKFSRQKVKYSLFNNNCKNIVVRALKKGSLKGSGGKSFIQCLNAAEDKLYPNVAYKMVRDFLKSSPSRVLWGT